MSVATMPNRVIFLLQFGGYWREVWTDGRALPTKVGGYDKDSLDPTYMGYSVGRWEDDYNFVVDTTGLDERTWVLRDGTPHSVMAHVQERFTRVDHNTMKVSMTIDDPKMYAKPWSLGTYYFRWIPNQKINEWLCVPSEQLKYCRSRAIRLAAIPMPHQHVVVPPLEGERKKMKTTVPVFLALTGLLATRLRTSRRRSLFRDTHGDEGLRSD